MCEEILGFLSGSCGACGCWVFPVFCAWVGRGERAICLRTLFGCSGISLVYLEGGLFAVRECVL